jgi:hypothetical protein
MNDRNLSAKAITDIHCGKDIFNDFIYNGTINNNPTLKPGYADSIMTVIAGNNFWVDPEVDTLNFIYKYPQQDDFYDIICPESAPHYWSDTKTLWENIKVIGKEHTKQCFVQGVQINDNARLLINGKSPFDLGLDESIIQDILSGS